MRFPPLAAALAVASLLLTPAVAQHTSDYTYDALGRLMKVDRDRSGCSYDRTTLYDWDDASNRERVRTTQGECANRAPRAANDTITVRDTYSKTLRPLDNDSDPDGDPLQFESVDQCPTGCVVTRISPTQLQVMGTREGTYRFTYTVTDRRGGTDSATVTVNVGDRNGNGTIDP